MWAAMGIAAGALVATVLGAFIGGRR